MPDPKADDYQEKMSVDWFSSFTIAPHGLTFYFGPYMYGPFAQGTIIVRIAWEDLAAVIDPVGPAGRWVE